MNSREELIKRLREAVSSDHARGCEGRQYACDCGHDLMIEGLLEMAADEIERNAVAQRPLPQPVMWVCLVEAARAGEKHIRAWTSDPERAQRFREIDGLDMQPLYAVTSADQREAGRVEVTDGSVQQGDIITYALTDEGLGKIISHARPVTSTGCQHKSVHDGPRVDARWGTVPTQVCDCGAWRTMHHTPGQWQTTPVTSTERGGK